MEAGDKMGMVVKKEAVTYIFGSDRGNMTGKDVSGKRVWQIVPVVFASLSCLPFGLMLGWPSPTNPILLEPNSAIPISIDQSAMIAGFLMIGNALGTPFSNKRFMESKYGILLGVTFMTTGWFLMWQARDIFWLLGSRILVGFGNGYGAGQLKIYISELCDDDLKTTLTKQINLYVFVSIVAVFSFGPFLDFRQTSFVALLVTIAVFFLLLLLPSTPVNLIKARQFEQAAKLISFLKPRSNTADEVNRIVGALETTQKDFSLWAVVSDRALRKRFLVFACLVFCQQWSGAPATMIYTQILFERSHCPHAVYLAIAYAAVYFFANVLGIYLTPKYDKRKVLLVSTSGVILLTAAKISVIFLDLNETLWGYSSVPVMYLFLIVHTAGLGSVPITLIADFFSKEYRTCVTHFFIMFHSISALVITKIFQVLMSQYDVGVAFCLFLAVSVVAFVFIYFVLPKTEPNPSIRVLVMDAGK